MMNKITVKNQVDPVVEQVIMDRMEEVMDHQAIETILIMDLMEDKVIMDRMVTLMALNLEIITVNQALKTMEMEKDLLKVKISILIVKTQMSKKTRMKVATAQIQIKIKIHLLQISLQKRRLSLVC